VPGDATTISEVIRNAGDIGGTPWIGFRKSSSRQPLREAVAATAPIAKSGPPDQAARGRFGHPPCALHPLITRS